MKSVIAEGVKEIWLSSEDTGAYGTNLRPPCWNLLKLLDVLHFFHFLFPNLVCLFQFLLFFLYIWPHNVQGAYRSITGFYAGIDLGTDLPTLLNALVAVLPEDQSTMLRIGMTNPPYILKHLESIAAILNHPCVYSFLHVPVQSGSDNVLRVSFPTLNVYAS